MAKSTPRPLQWATVDFSFAFTTLRSELPLRITTATTNLFALVAVVIVSIANAIAECQHSADRRNSNGVDRRENSRPIVLFDALSLSLSKSIHIH